jgi:hypothetical protein
MTEKRFALIIGDDQYKDVGLKKLRAPAEDVVDLSNVLQDPTIGCFEVQTLLNEKTYKVKPAIEAFFTDRTYDDLSLLYFSCHGVKNESGQLYFATRDTQLKLLDSTAISTNFINDVMSHSRSRRQVLLLDCCYSGAFARGMAVKAGKSIGINERFKWSGRAVLTSSDAMEYSFEEGEPMGKDVHSLFTRALVHGLKTGKADLDGDGFISIFDLYDYVYNCVSAKTSQQRPMIMTFVKGTVIIAKNRNPTVKPKSHPRDVVGIDKIVFKNIAGICPEEMINNFKNGGITNTQVISILKHNSSLEMLGSYKSKEISPLLIQELKNLENRLEKLDKIKGYKLNNSLYETDEEKRELHTIGSNIKKTVCWLKKIYQVRTY